MCGSIRPGCNNFRQKLVMMLAAENIPNDELSGHSVGETTGSTGAFASLGRLFCSLVVCKIRCGSGTVSNNYNAY